LYKRHPRHRAELEGTLMLKTRLCDLLGIQHPLIAAPMGPNLSDVDLVAAVSEAGALGVLQAQLCPPEMLREKLQELRRRASKPFGVNLIMHFPHEHLLEVCLAEGVPIISFFWGDPASLVERCHRAGAKVMLQVGSVEAARRAAVAGARRTMIFGVAALLEVRIEDRLACRAPAPPEYLGESGIVH
jgi:nitronate monooxygenase